jgi:hypothetical protein
LSATTGANIGSMDRPTPEPGTVTICAECGTLLIFDSAMKLLRPDPAMAERVLKENPYIRPLLEACRNGQFSVARKGRKQ